MSFNDLRRQVATSARTLLGEGAVFTPKVSAVPVVVRVIIHRKRAYTASPNAQARNPSLAQSTQTATLFKVDGDLVEPKVGDRIALDDTGEVFEIEGQVLLRDEFKTIVPVKGPII